MGVSENSVPLNPMVNDHYPYKMAIIGNIPYFQTNPYTFVWTIFGISRVHLVLLISFAALIETAYHG